MPRPQFTLRALLVAVLVVGAFFGGWRLFETHAQYVAVEPNPSTGLLTINGCIVRFLGPPTIDCTVGLFAEAHNGHAGVRLGDTVVERHWFCVYPIEVETDALANDFSRFGAMVFADDVEITSPIPTSE